MNDVVHVLNAVSIVTGAQWVVFRKWSARVWRAVSSAAALPLKRSRAGERASARRAVGFYLPPLCPHSLSHCAPNPSLLCGEFHRRDSGSLSVPLPLQTGPANAFFQPFQFAWKSVCPPAVFNTKKTTERHTVTSEHRNEGDYERALIITQFFCLFFSFPLTFCWYWKEQPRLCACCQLRHMFASLCLLCVSLESFHVLNLVFIFLLKYLYFDDLP